MSCSIILKQKGFRLTPQRRMILELLHSENTHLTAEHIYEKIKGRIKGVNISTVYRTLELLEDLGLVVKSEYEHGHIYHHRQESHHHHLVCQVCGKEEECPEELMLPLVLNLRDRYGFIPDLNHLVISGICAGCKDIQPG